jgi:hypothetical protein
MMDAKQMWTYDEDPGAIVGYTVEATDGEIGKVDKHNAKPGQSFLIVDTGPWIFGRTVMLPAGVVDHIDSDAKVVHVTRSKDDIKNAPEFVENGEDDAGYREDLGGFYTTFWL